MAQYIDKDTLVAEIEKVIDEPAPSHDQQCPWEDGYYCGLYKVENIIENFKVKEIKENNVWHDARKVLPEDSTSQIICIKEDGLALVTIGKIVNNTIKWAYLNDLKE